MDRSRIPRRVLARRVGEEESERGRSLPTDDCETASAWKTDPDFSNALIMALEAGELKLLRDYVVSSRPVPQVDAFVAGKSDRCVLSSLSC